MDWSLGEYERTAVTLQPAAATLIEHAGLRSRERLLDLGCGTGNAALLAAHRGARVTGVDPAARLLDVARARARSEGLEIRFLSGEAAALPLADASVDVVVSVFGVIFAADAAAAASEMARVTAPRGRIVVSAWNPSGPIFELMQIRREAIAGPPTPVPFAWHDPQALSGLFGPLGFSVGVHEHGVTFEAASAAAFVDGELEHHPMWLRMRDQLDGGDLAALRERMVDLLARSNVSAGECFAVTSRYVVAVLSPA